MYLVTNMSNVPTAYKSTRNEVYIMLHVMVIGVGKEIMVVHQSIYLTHNAKSTIIVTPLEECGIPRVTSNFSIT